MSWSRFDSEAPQLAAAVRARFETHPHHVLATVRASGAPRVSGTNVSFRDGHVWLGSMPGSVKGTDLLRDARFALHSAPLDERLRGGDAKIAGLAHLESGDVPGEGDSYRLELWEASVVEVSDDHLVITSWSAGSPARIRTRA